MRSLRLTLVLLFPLMLIACVIGLVAYVITWIVKPATAWNIAIAFDQVVNASFKGNPDETASSRAGRAARKGDRWGCILCKLLDKLDPDHCEKSIEEQFTLTFKEPR